MKLNTTPKSVYSFLFRPRRRAGLWLTGVLACAASVAFSEVTNKVYFGVAPAAYGYLTNAVVNGAATTLVKNATNDIVDPTDGGGVPVSLEAKPANSVQIFSYWSGSLATDLPNASDAVISELSILGDGDLVANFANKVTLRVSSANTVFGNTIPVSGSTTGVPLGRAVSVTAVPNVGYEFSYWTNVSGNVTVLLPNSATTLVTANSATGSPEVRAFFKAKKMLTVVVTGLGQISMSSDVSLPDPITTNKYYFADGETVTLTAIGLGQSFKKWETFGVPVLLPYLPQLSFVITNNPLVTATFGNLVTLTLVSGGNGNVQVNSETPVESSGTFKLDMSSYATITATPSNNYAFLQWATTNGAPLTNYPSAVIASLLMDHDYNFKAVFTNKYTVTVSEHNGPGTASSAQDVVAGKPWSIVPGKMVVGNATIRDIVTGYKNGTGDVTPVSGNGTNVTEVATQSSTFGWTWQKQYNLITSATGGGGVTPDTTGLDVWKDEGTTNTITAVYDRSLVVFKAWSINGVDQADRSETLTLVMDGPKNVVAIYQQQTPDTDNDGLPTWWEIQFGLDPISTTNVDDGANGDPDRDGLSNMQEYLLAVTNAPGNIQYFMNPCNADSDGDGMDDYYEAVDMLPTNLVKGDLYISAAMIPSGDKGPLGNPDGDFKWDTQTGYQMLNQPLINFDEWTGPDQIPPCTYVDIPWNTAYPTDAARSTVIRRRTPAWPADTSATGNDQSNPRMTDSDGDTFDDGFEWSWDVWHQANIGKSILANSNYWPTVTNTVPDWPSGRRFNPRVPLIISPTTIEPDYDRLYDPLLGNATLPFTDLDEYHASVLQGNAAAAGYIPFVRQNQRPEPWCTNPFLWDTDGDGLPDGWELVFGYDPWSTDSDVNGVSDAAENSDGDGFAFGGAIPYVIGSTTNYAPIAHKMVYDSAGFDPWTGWTLATNAVNTKPYSNIYEFVGSDLTNLAGMAMGWIPGTSATGTNPRNVDTDHDGMWDGWELYIGQNPCVAALADADQDKDNLLDWQEFMSLGVTADWRRLIQAGQTPDEILPMWLAFIDGWANKLLPTNPLDKNLPYAYIIGDTDGDQINDFSEMSYCNYIGAGFTNSLVGIPAGGPPLTVGGGLNPCTVDTDGDFLPDYWEAYFTGTFSASGATTVIVISTNSLTGVVTATTNINALANGMNGTVADALEDPDGDGLYNYQEYLVGACYMFQYAYNDGMNTSVDPMGSGYDPYDFFNLDFSGMATFHGDPDHFTGDFTVGPGALGANTWDQYYYADKAKFKRFTFISASFELLKASGVLQYSTCDPTTADTDHDGYDDFYELYHCLNPIRGNMDRVYGKLLGKPELKDPYYGDPLDYDHGYWFRWGERPGGSSTSPVADYDQDGEVDVEENLSTNLPSAQAYYHTDPSPYSVADYSSTDSYVNRFYKTGHTFGARRYWFWDPNVLHETPDADGNPAYPSAYLFTFECNEGYDTDNDLVSDGIEIKGGDIADPNRGATDPLDEDSPLRQRALYLDGIDSAVRMYTPTFHSWYSFRSFTAEAWVRPEDLSGDRVVVERAGLVTSGNPGTNQVSHVTRNVRLGVNNGVPYVSYDGYGENWTTESVTASPKFKLEANKWTHLAGVFDAAKKKLMLYVNGELAFSKSTTVIPFNGYIAQDPLHPDVRLAHWMSVTIGATDYHPEALCDGTLASVLSGRYSADWGGGSLPTTQPELHNYFKGSLDEVHLWDGSRTAAQIRALKGQKLTRALISFMNGVQTGNQTFSGDMGGGEGDPKLLYAYNFDSMQTPEEGIIPKGFDSTVAPAGWSQINWWAQFTLASSIYTDRRYVKWITNMATHQPFDPPRDTRSVHWISNGTSNNFPNTSNPYTVEYVHGQGGSWEVHPQYGVTQPIMFQNSVSTDPSIIREYSGLYGDMLPLGAARSIDNIEMWDGSIPSNGTRDQDGDGIPDLWEEQHGLDPLNPLDAQDDPDRDGMSTRQEYIVGSDPFGAFSVRDNIWDFFAYTNGATGPYLFLGEQYTDMDYMDDLWESAYGLNTEMYDATGPSADPDGDGWSNLSEFQSLVYLHGSGGTNGFLNVATNLFDAYTPLANNAFYLGMLGDLSFLQNQGTNTNSVVWSLEWNDPRDERFHPVPELIFRFQYAGKSRALSNPNFVVLAYSDRLMEVPDASIRGTGDRTTGYPRYMALNVERANSYSFEGNIREGLNWFWGFIDLNGDHVYQANEPAGFTGPVDVRWGSVGPIDIPLTDKRPMGFARFSWDGVTGTSSNAVVDPSQVEYYHVYIVDKNIANAPTVFYRKYPADRTWMMEADMMAVSKLAKGFKRSGGYQWYVRAEYDNVLHDVKTGMVYENYPTTMPAPTLVWPSGNGRLRQSRDTFIWKMDDSVTKCILTVKRRDTAQVVLTYAFAPPARDIFGRYKMEMPIYIGDGVFKNGVYDYTLTVQSPVATASATSQFSVRIGDYPGYSYSLAGTFIYPGKVTTGNFVVEAFTTPGFGGVAAGRTIIPNTIKENAWPTNVFAFTVRGLAADQYYVRVFLDQNDAYPTYTADDFESQGWFSKNFYWPESVDVSGTQTAKLTDWVKVLMRDTDNDRLPDDWEYRWNGNLSDFGLGDLNGYTPALYGQNVFEAYSGAPLGNQPK